MGIGMGYAVGAATVSGKPVVAIEGDSAAGLYNNARYDKMIEAFGGKGYHVEKTADLQMLSASWGC